MSPEKLPIPLPPEPEPPKGLKAYLQYRFLLVALVIVLFFGLLFGLGVFRKSKTADAPGHPATPVAALAPEPVKEKAAPVEPAKPEVAGPSKTVAPEPPKTTAAEPARPEKPAHQAEATAPPSLAPAPAPHQAAPVAKIKGQAFTHALAKIMDDQVNKTLFGWRPNTLIFGKLGLTDDVNNMQLGVLEVARRTIIVLNENMTRFAVTESHNLQVNEAMNFLMVSPDKYWFPSASGKYQEAIQNLEQYREDLRLGRSHYYSRVDNLIALFSNYRDILGSCYFNLVKDTEADGSPVSWFKTDDYFYFSKGVALSLAEMLEAVKEDFHDELQKKNTLKLLEDAIHALHEASHLSPWVVTNAAKDGFLANHRANLSTFIGEAEHLVATLQNVLATN
jgi:hypothetical protein